VDATHDAPGDSCPDPQRYAAFRVV
jgi:hypothetical protein